MKSKKYGNRAIFIKERLEDRIIEMVDFKTKNGEYNIENFDYKIRPDGSRVWHFGPNTPLYKM